SSVCFPDSCRYCRLGGRICNCHRQARDHRPSGAIDPGVERRARGLCRGAEERERSDRIVVRLERSAGARLSEELERVRVSIRKGTAPAVGSFIEFKARLSPPLEPLRPGGYDFARDMYFQRLGASGFVLGAIRTVEAPHAAGLRLRYAAFVEGM